MSRTDGIDELDPRFPIHLAPQSPAFWDTLRLWECYPSHPAQAFARDEAAHAVELNAREETTFIQPLPPEPPPPASDSGFEVWREIADADVPVPYPPLAEDELAAAYLAAPLPPVPGDPDCPSCHGNGDCLECDPETTWK